MVIRCIGRHSLERAFSSFRDAGDGGGGGSGIYAICDSDWDIHISPIDLRD